MPKSKQSNNRKVNQQSLEIVYQVARERMRQQSGIVNSLSQKLNFILAFNAVVAAGIIEATKDGRSFLELLSVSFLITSMVVSLFGLWVRKYRGDPLIEKFYTKYAGRTPDEIKRQLISEWADGVEENKVRMRHVRNYILWSIGLSITGLLLFLLNAYFGGLTYWHIILCVLKIIF